MLNVISTLKLCRRRTNFIKTLQICKIIIKTIDFFTNVCYNGTISMNKVKLPLKLKNIIKSVTKQNSTVSDKYSYLYI